MAGQALRAASDCGLLAAVALLASCATPHRQDLARFESVLAAQDSATAGLTRWCAQRHLAPTPQIRAERITDQGAPRPTDLARLLDLPPGSRPGYRHVRLSCGGVVLSQAHNWYVPARLTQQMNAALDTTDTPFGTVAAPLAFTRERLSSTRGGDPACPKGTILYHRALLRLPGGSPLALVVECYTPAVLRD